MTDDLAAASEKLRAVRWAVSDLNGSFIPYTSGLDEFLQGLWDWAVRSGFGRAVPKKPGLLHRPDAEFFKYSVTCFCEGIVSILLALHKYLQFEPPRPGMFEADGYTFSGGEAERISAGDPDLIIDPFYRRMKQELTDRIRLLQTDLKAFE
jgi:hypothetical protein